MTSSTTAQTDADASAGGFTSHDPATGESTTWILWDVAFLPTPLSATLHYRSALGTQHLQFDATFHADGVTLGCSWPLHSTSVPELTDARRAVSDLGRVTTLLSAQALLARQGESRYIEEFETSGQHSPVRDAQAAGTGWDRMLLLLLTTYRLPTAVQRAVALRMIEAGFAGTIDELDAAVRGSTAAVC